MGAKKIQERVSLKSPGFLTAFSILGHFFLAAGGFAFYIVFLRGLIRMDQLVGGAGFIAFALGFIALLLFIGGALTKMTQGNMNELVAFETSSTTTTAKTVKRGRKKHTDRDGSVSYTYWITVQFQPARAKNDIVLRVPVGKKRHDAFAAGQYFKVRYLYSNPCVALMEWETNRIERSINFGGVMLPWILANIIGGAAGFYISNASGVDDLLMSGAIAGLIIAEAQWIVLFRYFPVSNWKWVVACMIGWAAFVRLNTLAYGLVGGIILGGVQWFILRKKVAKAEWWVAFTAAGMSLGQTALNLVFPGSNEAAAGISFDFVYGAITGIGIYLIARQSLYQDIPTRSLETIQESQDSRLEPVVPDGLGKAIDGEMKLVLNGKAVSGAPDEHIIRQTLESLIEQEEGFTILSYNEMTYIQAAYIGGEAFVMEYQAGSTTEHYDCITPDLDLTKVAAAFTMFLESDDRLLTEFLWELMAV